MKNKTNRWVRYPIYPYMQQAYMPEDPIPINSEEEDDLH